MTSLVSLMPTSLAACHARTCEHIHIRAHARPAMSPALRHARAHTYAHAGAQGSEGCETPRLNGAFGETLACLADTLERQATTKKQEVGAL